MLARDRDDSRPTPIEASFPPGRNCYELYNICLYGAEEVATPVSETVVMSEHPSYESLAPPVVARIATHRMSEIFL